MRVECPTCGASYKVGDQKVAGKVVKIRCKRCGAILVVDGVGASPAAPPPALSPEPRLAERHEASVLFSLAALTAPTPAPPSPPSPPAHPAEDIVHLSAGGPFAAALAAPVLPPEPAAHPRPERRVWLAVGVGCFVAAGIAPLPLWLHSTRIRPAPPAPIAFTATLTPASTATAAPASAATTAASLTPTPSRTRTPAPTPTLAPTLTREPSLTRTPSRCCPGETPAACEMRLAVGEACASAPPFDGVAARRALEATDVSSCKTPGVSSGTGHVRVTFEPSGAVAAAVVDSPPYAGTAAGACIARRFRAARVAAFSGGALTVGKSFSLP